MTLKRKAMVLLLLVTIAFSFAFLPVEQVLLQLQRWASAEPDAATYIVGTAFALGVILVLPVAPLVMLAGFLFGLIHGLLLVWFAGLIASTIAFWVGRTVARPWVERKLMNKSTFVAIDRAIARKGFLIVLLTRIVMVLPYAPLNYSLGLSRVNFLDYLLATNIGMIVPFFVVVYLGTTAGDAVSILTGEIRVEGADLLVGFVALAIVILAAVLIIRSALGVLREELATVAKEKSVL